jgi:hypothetical protein
MLRGKIVYSLGTVGLVVIVIAGFFAFYLPRASRPCVVENCHGLEIECGTKAPEVCTEVYMLGDSCRQYADCERVASSCQPAKSEKFDSCKSCVEKCQEDFREDSPGLFQCESGCASYGRDYWSAECPESRYAIYAENGSTMLGCEPLKDCSANSDCEYLMINKLPPRNGACVNGTCKAYCGSGILREC